MKGDIVYIERQCKLRCRGGCLCIEDGGESRKVFLDDIAAVVLASREISVSVCLLDEFAGRSVTVVTCDKRKFPRASLVPMYGTGCAFRRAKEQLSWQKFACDVVWGRVVSDKIAAQSAHLDLHGLRHSAQPEVLPGDPTNAEGRFADIYFRALFGRGFRRHLRDGVNAALDYGYVILTSLMARIIAAHGYMPFIGFHHSGEANNINLACDCVEPFRPLVDFAVKMRGDVELDKEYKARLLDIIYADVEYGGRRLAASDAMEEYFLDAARSLKDGDMHLKKLVIL